MRKYLSYINKFPRARVLVIGDIILDEYVYGMVERISPEAPVPVVWARRRSFVPGGAANVASNLRALGARVALAGVVGSDHYKDIMFSELRKRGIDITAVIEEKGDRQRSKAAFLPAINRSSG